MLRPKDWLSSQTFRYALTGGFNTGLCILVYMGGILLHFGYVTSNAVSWVVGLLVSFALSSWFVFKKAYAHHRFAAFIASNVFCLAASMAILTMLIQGLSVTPIVAPFISTPIVTVLNFLIMRNIVFR